MLQIHSNLQAPCPKTNIFSSSNALRERKNKLDFSRSDKKKKLTLIKAIVF